MASDLLINVIVISLGCLISGLLYWVGGQSKDVLLWANTKIRDVGCPIIMLLVMYFCGQWHISLLISAALLFGALTTYWTPKNQEDVKWWNWALTGFFYGLSMMPYAYFTNRILAGAMYTIFLTVMIAYASEGIDEDFQEEFSRGALIILSLPILWII